MRAPRLLVRRGRAQWGALLTLLVLTATVAAILAGSIGYTRAAGVATVRATLAEAAPRDAGVQVQTRLAAAADAQDVAVRASVGDLLGDDVLVSRALWSEALGAQGGGEDLRVVLAELPAGGVGTAVTGALPGPGEALVPDRAAADAGLSVGSVVDVGDTSLTVSGTWRAADERTWFADPLVAGGGDGSAVGPLLTDAATLTGASSAPFVRWTLYPDAGRLTVAGLAPLSEGLAALDYELGNDDAVAVRGLTVTGELAGTVVELEEATSTAAAVGLVPVALLAVVSLVALVQVVRLLGQTRAREVEILVARGAAPRQVTSWSAAEIAVVSVVGAALGTALAAAVVGRLDGGADHPGAILGAGVAVASLAVLSGTVVAGLQVRGIARRMVADRSGRLQGAATVGTTVLTAAAAILSTWQLLRHGTPLLTDDDGATQADVLAVVSLGAVLAALAVLALALLGPATRVVARARARNRGVVGVLAARQVSRRVRAYAVPLVLVVLAVGATTVASSFAGVTAVQREQVAALEAGSDVRVTVPVGSTARLAQPQSVSAVPYRELAGVSDAGVVLRADGTFGELPVAVTALDTRRDVATVPGAAGVADAVPSLAADRPGIALPAGTRSIELTVRAQLGITAGALAAEEEQLASMREYYTEVEGLPEEDAEDLLEEARAQARSGDFALGTILWVADGDGALSMLDVGPLPADPEGEAGVVGPAPSEHALAASLPGTDEYRLVALDLAVSGPEIGYEVAYEVVSVAADGQDVALGDAWAAVEALDTAPGLRAGGVLGVRGELGGGELDAATEVRLMPPGAAEPLPALLTAHLATSADLAPGAAATVALAGTAVDLTVDGTVDAVPGGLEEDAVLVDLAALGLHVLRREESPLLPGEVWLAVDGDAAAVAAAAREAAGGEASVEVAGDGLTDSAASVRQTFWIVAAGAVLLALTGVTAVTLTLTRERRGEVVVLRALGLPPASQVRTRVAELLGVGALGVLLGVVAGWAASALLVPTLARAAATQVSPLPLGGAVDPLPALGLLVVLVLGLLAVAGVLAARVRSQALDAEYREEVR